MKLTAGLILFALFTATAVNTYSQTARINLNLKNATIVDIFREIERSSEFGFFFKSEEMNLEKRQSIMVSEATIDEVLKKVLTENYSYQILDKNIVVTKGKFNATEQQGKTITGKVTDSSGASLPGATIIVKGSNVGVVTDVDGNYRLNLPDNARYLIFSFVGMETQEVETSNRTQINIKLISSTIGLEDVVVTALGITREKKGLGYAVQQIQGDDLNKARETNFVNALAGKVAGVNITSSGAVGSSSRIIIRGEKSLNFFGNEPLYVVDGVPVGNSGTSNTTSVDYGNNSAEINPADIESMTVLKGPAASALYGSRASNGVIVITTKSGKKNNGLGVSVNSGTTFEQVLRFPKFQNEFGAGYGGKYEGSNFGAGWSIYPAGIEDSYDESWGPRLNVGTLERQPQSPTLGGMRGGDVANPNRGEIIPTPWIAYPNNLKDFFETGKTYFNNVSLTGSNEKGDFRFSFTNLDQTGIIPNNDLQRNTFALKGKYKFTDKFRAEASMNYINSKSTNRPETGYGRNSIMYFMTWSARNMDINSLRNYWQNGFEGKRQFQFNYGENHNNPFFYQHENTRGQDKHHLFGTAELNYDFSKKLTLMARAGTDMYHDFRPMKWAVSTAEVENGKYQEDTQFFMEQNFDFLLNYKEKIGENFNYRVSFGGNQMNRSGRMRSIVAPELLIPGIYTLTNNAAQLGRSSYDSKMRVNSLYVFSQMDYKSTYYMDITARNDWSSTLPINNNSFFYPSVSLSALTNQIVKMPQWVDQAKIRLGLAQVGNGTGPYSLYSTLNFGTPWGDNNIMYTDNVLKNNNLKPEITFTYEVGTDIKLFKNRLGIDFTYYDTRSRNQIISIPLTSSTSYSSRIINAGEIQNYGFEIMLNAVPIKLANGFQWNIALNYSLNRGKVNELADGITAIVQSAPGEEAQIIAKVGERMGAIWGPGYKRVESGPLAGQIIIAENGKPVATDNFIHVGNINPDWIGSLSNNFSYKNVTLGLLIDLHYGGQFLSHFYNKAMGSGQLLESGEGRSARAVGHEYDDPYYIVGAALVNGEYVPNSTSTDGTFSEGKYGVDARDFHKRLLDHFSEGQMFDATYAKLREVTIGYKFPNKLFGNILNDVQLSLVGRNLFLWTPSSNQHFDPEVAAATSGSGIISGFEDMSLPSTRSYGFNLSLKF